MAPKAPIGAARMTMATIPEEGVRGLVDQAEQHVAAAAEVMQSDREQDREEQHLQYFALGESTNHRVGDDVHEMANDRLLLGWAA